ncbi:MAG: hypothetical protein HXY24_07020 [Rubrivivax sp.]|nr:hypothetical protein [Rubrivivax sp.]
MAAPARAADPATDAMQAAYAPYRVALFRTNGKSQPESEQAMADAMRAWATVVERFAAAPPAPYASDARFAATVNDVAAVYREADRLVRAGRLTEAHEELEKVRGLLADLRQRNGVVVFSDHMNAYHAEMEHVIGDGPKLLREPQGALLLMARVGALEYLAERLRTQAPPALQADAEFAAGQKAVEGSVATLKRALLDGQDAAAVERAIGALKGPYSRLFLKFG